MRITLRNAVTQDFEYCRRLYFAGMKTIIEDLALDVAAQTASFPGQWVQEQVRIISADGADVGWLQSNVREGGLFVAQLFVDGPFQKQGIGTEVMKQLIGETSALNQAVSLAVVKINPALRLYERLGFRITHQDDRKFYMTRNPDAPGFLRT
jgi:GNAT superfamily N-acetyltransferase